MKKLLFITLFAGVLSGCQKSEDSVTTEQLASKKKLTDEPTSGFIKFSAKPFSFCLGEMAEYNGSVPYTITLNGNDLHFVLSGGDIRGLIGTSFGYDIFTSKDTVFTVAPNSEYIIPLRQVWHFDRGHITLNHVSRSTLKVEVSNNMKVDFTSSQFIISCLPYPQ